MSRIRMRVLLTGATGFIGGRLLPALDDAGVSVRCLVRPGETLVEGLKNEVICRDTRILELVPIPLTRMDAAICTALAQAADGPGKLPSRQACFLGR